MNHIAPIDAKMKDQERAKQMALAKWRREELKMQQQMQIEAAMGKRAKEDDKLQRPETPQKSFILTWWTAAVEVDRRRFDRVYWRPQ